jgi:hypothetical protein
MKGIKAPKKYMASLYLIDNKGSLEEQTQTNPNQRGEPPRSELQERDAELVFLVLRIER